MLYFCADDYGIAKESNVRISDVLKNGILNKVSVLPNGEISDLKERLSGKATLSLHINLIEGRPLSNPEDVSLLVSDKGFFKYSFEGLFFLALSPKRKKIEKQLYTEILCQIKYWKSVMGEDASISIDSHQHTHMIPLIFKTLVKVINDEGVHVESIRIPAEPIYPYLCTPSLYFSYSPIGIIKQWVLKFLAFINRKERKKLKAPSAYVMGIMFSGKMNESKTRKLLPHYLKLAKKKNKDIEIIYHPGYLKNGETTMDGTKKGFNKFYFSQRREKEYEFLSNYK